MFFYNQDDGEEAQPIILPITDPYFNNVNLLLKMDTNFGDSSLVNNTITTSGNPTISTADSKYGGASAYFGGSDKLIVANSSNLDMTTGDWTLEAWLKFQGNFSVRRSIFSKYSTGQGEWWFSLKEGTGNLRFENGLIGHDFNAGIPFDQWAHVAFVRSGTVVTAYVDGVAIGTMTHNLRHYGSNLQIGGTGWNANWNWVGYMDDIRFTKGVARYTADFTPPDSLPTS